MTRSSRKGGASVREIERATYREVARFVAGSALALFFVVAMWTGLGNEERDLPTWVGPVVAWSFAWSALLWWLGRPTGDHRG